jgi:hypothetical protein
VELHHHSPIHRHGVVLRDNFTSDLLRDSEVVARNTALSGHVEMALSNCTERSTRDPTGQRAVSEAPSPGGWVGASHGTEDSDCVNSDVYMRFGMLTWSTWFSHSM